MRFLKILHLCWDSFLLDACGHFLLVPGSILAWDALARILNHVRVGSKTRARHDAPLRSLEVSCCFSIKVSTKTTRSRSQQIVSKDLSMFSIKGHEKTLLDSIDFIGIILSHLNFKNFHTIMTDDFYFSRLDFDDLLLSIHVQVNLHVVCGHGGHENFSNTSKNLNFLGGTIKISSHNSNWNFSRTIFKQKMEAVVQFIIHHLGIKSADMSRSNMTSRRGNSVESIESNKPEGSSQRDGQNALKKGRETNISDFISSSIEINDQLSLIPNTADLCDYSHFISRDVIAGSFNQVTNDQSFQHIHNVGNNKFNFLESAEVSRDTQLSANLIYKSSLMTNQFTNISKRTSKLFFFSTTQKFWRIADRFNLLF